MIQSTNKLGQFMSIHGHIYSESTDKTNILMTTLLSIHHFVFPYVSLATEFYLPDYILDSFTENPVESILSSLQLGKATGSNVINTIILKELKNV